MGHNGSWISRNASEQRNASGAEAGGANRSALEELGEVQLYRQFTTAVQVVIFIGSLLERDLEHISPRSIHSWSSMVMLCLHHISLSLEHSPPAYPLPDSTTVPPSVDVSPGAPFPVPSLCIPLEEPSSPCS
uniref:G protein-coupled receptor 176 n=1 Tax=Suricata suricatta TaxID=37032 RepID=A0A673UBS5_SURSU